METVTLKNGAEEPQILVAGTMLSLRTLHKDHPVALYELMMLCRQPDHELFGNARNILESFGLIEPNGQPHDSTRNIVLSAMEGDGFEARLTNPTRR